MRAFSISSSCDLRSRFVKLGDGYFVMTRRGSDTPLQVAIGLSGRIAASGRDVLLRVLEKTDAHTHGLAWDVDYYKWDGEFGENDIVSSFDVAYYPGFGWSYSVEHLPF